MAIVHTAGFRPRIYEESAWYAPIAQLLARFDTLTRFPSPAELSALYEARTCALALPPLRFVEARKTKKKRKRKEPIELGTLYEGRIVERGEVPTRPDDWHDLFNALAFVTFPRAKWALHARQYALLKARLAPLATRLPNARTREQDALSLFDEGGLCVATLPALAPSLHEASDAVLAAAIARGEARAVPFGHALYEHLVAGLPAPLATTYVVALPEGALAPAHLLDALDAELARALEDPREFQVPSSARGSSLAELAHALSVTA